MSVSKRERDREGDKERERVKDRERQTKREREQQAAVISTFLKPELRDTK